MDSKPNRKNWMEEELIVAFNLYCKLSFGQYHRNNKEVINLANILYRTPSAVALKLGNFARLDPAHKARGISGMSHGSKLDQKIWDAFNQNWEELAYESENILANMQGINFAELLPKEDEDFPLGKETEATVKVRVNQNFFRTMILANYRCRCSLCLLSHKDLLVAGHIIPWSANPDLRMNPSNGLCMCVLHEKAFDKGLITIDDDYRVVIARALKELSEERPVWQGFTAYEGAEINLPDKFLPDKKCFEFHREQIFAG